MASLLEVKYPNLEIIVSVDRASEGRRVRADVDSLFGDRGIKAIAAESTMGANAKIDAMEAGCRQAANEIVLFCDDDVLVDPGHLQHLVYHLGTDVQLVSAAAIGIAATNLWGQLECSFMNGQFARLHLAGDCLGFSGALGKTVLIRRADLLKAGGLSAASGDCCEDAALTRLVKKAKGQVALSALPALQPIGTQMLGDVLRRHRRWLGCRRKYLPLVFAAEALFSTAIAVVMGAVAADYLFDAPLLGVVATVVVWCGVDVLFAARLGYCTSMTPLVWLLRELIFGPLWLSALFARTVTWYGRRVPVSG